MTLPLLCSGALRKNACNDRQEAIWKNAWNTRAIRAPYDGFNTVESLKSLIDELMEIERIARKLLHEGRLFPDHTDSNTDGKAVD